METIFALSSGTPPAAIGVIRISGPSSLNALKHLVKSVPLPRQASVRVLSAGDGSALDRALVLWLPGPATVTGEDMAELHLHGGRAVIDAVEAVLAGLPGLRRAQPGEFTRRAFTNGRIDLAEAEGLADLLAAETELQRRNAQALAGGALSRAVEAWRAAVLALSAEVEAVLDFADEDDVAMLPADFAARTAALADGLGQWLATPRAETLRDGFRVVLAGPPNAGKSTLFNTLVEHEAAITAPEAGTTRDAIERAVAIDGVPFVFVDTAGLREAGAGAIEREGMARARAQAEAADLVLWLGERDALPHGAWQIATMADLDPDAGSGARHRVSAVTGQGIAALRRDLIEHARGAMPRPGAVALNQRQRGLLAEAQAALRSARAESDPLLQAESLRIARARFDDLTGRASTEHMLDTLFGRFCIGK